MLYYLISATNSLKNIDPFIKFKLIEIESTNGFKTKNWKSQLLAFNQPKRESFDELTGRRVLGARAARLQRVNEIPVVAHVKIVQRI